LNLSKEFRQPTWMISIDYDLFDKTLLYFTTRKGYKSGAINEGLKGSNADLLVAQPETVQDYELGIKSDWNFLTMPVRTNFDLYYTDYENIQTQVSLPFVALAVGPKGSPCTQAVFNAGACTGAQTGFVMVNAKTAEVYGFEWDLEAKPTPEFTLTWGGSYLHAYYTDFAFNVPAGYLLPGSGAANLTGTPFPVPQWQINASATYALSGDDIHLPVDEVSLTGQWYWQGTTLADYAGFQYPAMAAKSYLFTNLRLNVENINRSNISVSAFATNVFNVPACQPETNGTLNSVPNATFGTPNTSGVVQCVPLPPRMIGVSLRYVF
jgi:iron complex outermembrane receptor protein